MYKDFRALSEVFRHISNASLPACLSLNGAVILADFLNSFLICF